MRRTHVSVSLAFGALLVIGLVASPALATTAGTWSQFPTGATTYQAEVQQPINTANTSNWSSKSQGAIPVMFKLFSGTGAAVFESIGSDGYEGFTATGNFANDYAFASFKPDSLTFADITMLKTDYEFTLGDCHGGSLRWQVRTSPTQALFIYYGNYPQFGNGGVDGCTGVGTNSVDQSGTNLIDLPDLRYDTSQYASGTVYDSYANAIAIMGSFPVTRVSLVIDSGWQGLSASTDQRLNVSNITVNDSIYQWDAGGSGDLAATCDLPDARIQVDKTDPVVDGARNEAPVQASRADEGNLFRVVDCKYQYNLSIPSLGDPPGGTYWVEIKIGGVRVPTPASPNGKVKFDIK